MTVFEYVEPRRFVAGTVGPPGQRTFFLQAHDGRRTTSVSLEKSQVAVLAQRLDDLLDTLLRRSGGTLPIPAVVTAEQQDVAPLEAPIDDEFRVVGLSLTWDDEIERVVLEAYSVDPTAGQDDDDPDDEEDASGEEDRALPLSQVVDEEVIGDVLRVVLTGISARAFVARAESVVSAGRPPCPFCALPLDPEGHICPRQNGYRRQATSG
ncbi:MAG TPA: DUF3090 family protein [Actinomycetes bacterium]|nr:DUF3090 family protein [Actinomycetes bacterium]